MKTRVNSTKRIQKLVKRYWLVTTLILIALGTFLLGNALYINSKNNEIINNNKNALQQLSEAREIHSQAEAKKALEAKALQEEAASRAAEQAKHGSASDALSMDSKACNTATSHNDPSSIDVVVNKKHCIQPLSFSPSDLSTSQGATLSSKAMAAYTQLYAAAAAAGQPFYVTSSYRSYATQIATYNKWVATSGQAGADTYSARPGYSEHQTGLAFDVAAHGCTLSCFGSTSQYSWLQKNAAVYGFIQRYYVDYDAITGYKAEEWHYRYVGIGVAKDMQSKGIKTLEQYWKISGGDY